MQWRPSPADRVAFLGSQHPDSNYVAYHPLDQRFSLVLPGCQTCHTLNRDQAAVLHEFLTQELLHPPCPTLPVPDGNDAA